MIIRNSYLSLEFSETAGNLCSLTNDKGKEFLGFHTFLPLVTMRVRDLQGNAEDLSSEVQNITYDSGTDSKKEQLTIRISAMGNLAIQVTLRIVLPAQGKLSYWTVSISNHSEKEIEWIDLPGLRVPNDLAGVGGSSFLVWPGNEGTLILDASTRDEPWFPYWDAQYPSRGLPGGIYPGPVPTQFMAYYGPEGGLYAGTHDPYGNVKSFEYEKMPEGDIRLQLRQYLGAMGKGERTLEYPLVIGVFEGDWHDAADIYRNWFENENPCRPLKISENSDLPEWYSDSPVVVTYPVRGRHDTDRMEPNKLYPYTNALPILQHLSETLDSRILTLLMHWESTAPWAPPYVWPPYGDPENFRTFADQLHQENHILGVYCSGLGYTKQSNLIADYNLDRKIQSEGLLKYMNTGPNGKVEISHICTPQRSGYDMCGAVDFTHQTILSEIEKIIDGDVDYIQALDQNHGGTAYFCYSREHGHPAGPGKWQTEAMQKLYRELHDLSVRKGKKVLFGCESVSAEPFISGLQFNDARFELSYLFGRPIPLFAYLYHPYVNNFMGNQCCLNVTMDNQDAPDNLLYRLAYSFSAGDMLTIVLNEDGKAFWSWGEDPDIPAPDQNSILTFIREANAWRKQAPPYLLNGTMEKPYPAEGIESHIYHFRNGVDYEAEKVFVSCWRAGNGSTAEFFANYTGEEQTVTAILPECTDSVHLFRSASEYPDTGLKVSTEDGRLTLTIPPCSITMAEWK